MTPRIASVGLCVFVFFSLCGAQTKISGTVQCDKPDVQQKVDVADHAGHSMSISQAKCTWSKPLDLGGEQDKDGVSSGMEDIHGTMSTGHGYFVDNMANGDKAFVRWQGTTSMKDGAIDGKWSYTGGTGKLKGLKGAGTYKGKSAPDGSATFDVEGDYTLPK